MIVCSAIKILDSADKYPMIITGFRHADIYEKIFSLSLMPGIDYNSKKITEGFLNDKDQFLNRYEAKFEARKNNQLLSDNEDRALYSEDIWPE